ncbi:hypothetical protein OQA88_904 [Cercophora sp. LCS_1]
MRVHTLFPILALVTTITATPSLAIVNNKSPNSSSEIATTERLADPIPEIGPGNGIDKQVYIDCLEHEVDVSQPSKNPATGHWWGSLSPVTTASWGKRECKKDHRVLFAIRKHGFWASRHDCWKICKETITFAIREGKPEYECRWHSSGWNKCRLMYATRQIAEPGPEVAKWHEYDQLVAEAKDEIEEIARKQAREEVKVLKEAGKLGR